MKFYEASSKKDINVRNAFEELLMDIYLQRLAQNTNYYERQPF